MTLRQDTLRRIAWTELGRNAGPPAVCYPIFVVICATASDFGTRYPTLSVAFTVLLTVVGAARAWSGHRLTREDKPSLEITLAISTLLSAALWSAFTTSGIVLFGFSWTSQLLVIMSVGLSAGGTTTLGPNLTLLRGFVALQLLPPAIALIAHGNRESFSALVVLMYAVFLVSLGKRQNAFYWRALADNELLRLRTHELEDAKAAADALSRRTQTILDSAADGIVGVDCDGRITFVNPSAARMSGRPSSQLVGEDVSRWLRYEGAGLTAESCVLDACRNGAEHRMTGAAVQREDGSSVVVDFVATPIRDGELVTGAVITIVDVTQRHELDRMKDQFVSTVSHELRTPLTSIRGSLGLLAHGKLEGQPEAARRMVDIASTNTERLVRLVNDILDLQKIQKTGMSLEKKRCDVHPLIDIAVDNVRPFADREKICIVVEPVEARIMADPDRVVQALVNLLSNAVKFSEAGRTVTVSAQAVDGSVDIRVADEGIGIPPEKQQRIFDEFFQVDGSDSRSKGGTGLGLAITRRIAEAHGGSVSVDSEPGRGSTFHLVLPA